LSTPYAANFELEKSCFLYSCGLNSASFDNNKKLDGIIQNPKLFIRGNATSLEPT